jgi:hypothetical protein
LLAALSLSTTGVPSSLLAIMHLCMRATHSRRRKLLNDGPKRLGK